jgi:hypothetical protein
MTFTTHNFTMTYSPIIVKVGIKLRLHKNGTKTKIVETAMWRN